MRCFARNLGAGLLAILTFFLTCAAAEGDAIEGWVLWYAVAIGFSSIVCMVYGFGENNE